MEVRFIPAQSAAALDSTHNAIYFSALQLIEGFWQHFFSMRKCFMKLFWPLVFSDCFFAEPAIRQSFFSFVWESTERWHWRPQELERRWRLHRKWWTAIWFSRPHFNQRELCACHGFPVHFLNISFHFLNISGINTKKWGGIRDHCTAPGSWITSRWDRDQHYCKGIRDPVVQQKNKDHKILKWP